MIPPALCVADTTSHCGVTRYGTTWTWHGMAWHGMSRVEWSGAE